MIIPYAVSLTYLGIAQEQALGSIFFFFFFVFYLKQKSLPAATAFIYIRQSLWTICRSQSTKCKHQKGIKKAE